MTCQVTMTDGVDCPPHMLQNDAGSWEEAETFMSLLECLLQDCLCKYIILKQVMRAANTIKEQYLSLSLVVSLPYGSLLCTL